MRRFWLLAVGVMTLLAGLSIAHPFVRRSVIAPSINVSAITEIPTALVNTSFATKSAYRVASGTRILLIPHHLVAGREIASLLSSVPTPKRVLLLSPDHFSLGKTPFSLPKHLFSWQGRTIPTDPFLRAALEHDLRELVQSSEVVYKREHGVRGLLPFLTTAWPDAQIVPLTVRNDTQETALIRLIDTIDTHFSNGEDLFIFTIDFSHDLPKYIADLHDLLAEDALRALDAHATKDVEIDSKPLFWTLTSLASLQKTLALRNVTIHAHTNALSLMKAQNTELGTSHFIASFAPGEIGARRLSTTLVHDEHRLVDSKEDRFYQGFDAIATSTIPFPTNFVRIRYATGTEWRISPLKQVGDGWLPLNDRERKGLSPITIAGWIEWAKTHLTSTDRP